MDHWSLVALICCDLVSAHERIKDVFWILLMAVKEESRKSKDSDEFHLGVGSTTLLQSTLG